MRMLAGIVAVALLGGCQTQRQAIICSVSGAGVAGLGGLGVYSARNDDEGGPVIFPLAVLVGGAFAIVSLISLAFVDAETSAK